MDPPETPVYHPASMERFYTRDCQLMKRGLTEERVWKSAGNGRGPR
jgi:hypothetical protein